MRLLLGRYVFFPVKVLGSWGWEHRVDQVDKIYYCLG